jgi:hypothetical protein
MKKIFTFLFASFAIISANAQKNFDTALQSTAAVSATKVNSLFTEPASTLPTDNILQGTVKRDIIIMPNTATKDIKIVFTTDKAADATIVVLDENGKQVLHQDAKLSIGKNNLNIDNVRSLNEGTYTIQLISNNETHTSTFMMWK